MSEIDAITYKIGIYYLQEPRFNSSILDYESSLLLYIANSYCGKN